MSSLKKLFQHSSKYFILRVIMMSVSLISFPIITRIFTISEYGILALANTTIMILIALAKCGQSTAFAKKYAEYSGIKEKNLYSTSFWVQIIITIFVITMYIVALLLFRKKISENAFFILLVTSPIIFLRTIQALLLGFYRAEENIRSFNMAALVNRIGVAFIGILGAMHFKEKIVGFFSGVLAIETVISIYLIILKRKKIALRFFSLEIGKVLVVYGLPLIIFELSSLIISYADRYQIQYYLGEMNLGLYSAAYNLSMYIQELLTAPLWMAIFPIYTKIWHNEGRESTQIFLYECLKYYFLFAIPIIFGTTLIGRDIITLLSSSKYGDAAVVMPWVLGGMLINGLYHIISAGLYLNEKTSKIALYTAICGAINVGLNFVLIPRFGILGAAYATMIAYIILTSIISIISFKFLPISFPIKDILMYIAFSFAMVLAVKSIKITSNVIYIISAVLVGCISYTIMIILYDVKIRNTIISIIKKDK